jgi:hypothetical protein
LLGVDERPNLIDLNALTGEVYENPILVPSGSSPGIDHELADRLFAGARQAASRAD